MRMTYRDLVIMFVSWLILLCLFGALGVFMLNWFEYRRLAKTAVEATGTVTAKEPENHRFVRYSFSVNGHSYSGLGNAGGVNPEFEQLEIGSSVKVFYDPNDPDESFLGSPTDQSNSVRTGVIFLAVVSSLFSVFGLYYKSWLPVTKRP